MSVVFRASRSNAHERIISISAAFTVVHTVNDVSDGFLRGDGNREPDMTMVASSTILAAVRRLTAPTDEERGDRGGSRKRNEDRVWWLQYMSRERG